MYNPLQNTLQLTVTNYYSLQRTVTRCNSPTAVFGTLTPTCNILQHTASRCNTLQHTATHCNTLQHAATRCMQHTATHCNILQHTATHCNTLQHTATHFPVTVSLEPLRQSQSRSGNVSLAFFSQVFEWVTSHTNASSHMNESHHMWERVREYLAFFFSQVQPIADRMAQNLEIISKNFQFRTDSHGICHLLLGTNRKSNR